MDNKNNQSPAEINENKAKKVWMGIGLGALSVLLAVFTVLIINL